MQSTSQMSLQGRPCRLPSARGGAGRSGAVRVRSQAVAAGARSQKHQRPDSSGRYGIFGGRYVPETLIPALDELLIEYEKAKKDPAFKV